MKKFKELLKKPWAAYTFATCSAVLLFLVLANLSSIKNGLGVVWNLLLPIVIGAITAYLFNPLSNFFEKTLLKKVKKDSTRHTIGVVIVTVCFIILLAIILVALIPSLVQSISKLVKNWGVYTDKVRDIIKWVSAFALKHHIKIDLSTVNSFIDNLMEKIIDFFKGNYKSILSTLGNIGNGVISTVIGLLFGFCFLIAKESIANFFDKIRKSYIPEERIKKVNALYSRCNKIFLKYVGSTLLDALIIGICVLIFMLIMKMPYAPLIAVVCALLNIIPTFGPMISAAVGVFFLILENPWHALFFLIFVCTLQSIDGMVIKPKLFSGSLGIPAVWSLVLIIIGGKIAGILGILLAIPFAAIFVIIKNEYLLPKLEKRRLKINNLPDNPTGDTADSEPK